MYLWLSLQQTRHLPKYAHKPICLPSLYLNRPTMQLLMSLPSVSNFPHRFLLGFVCHFFYTYSSISHWIIIFYFKVSWPFTKTTLLCIVHITIIFLSTMWLCCLVYRGFWSVFMLLGVTAVVLGGFILICAAPFTSPCLYKAGGGLFLTAGELITPTGPFGLYACGFKKKNLYAIIFTLC